MTDQKIHIEKLAIGDLVRVSDDTHDSKLPPSRTGLIIGAVCEEAWNGEKLPVGVFNVWMTNGETLRFHEMFLEKVEKVESEKKKED